MINQVEAKPGLGMTYDTSLSPAPAPESQGESVAAPAEVGQVGGTSWIRRSVALRKADSDAIKAIAQAEGCTYEFAMRRLITQCLARPVQVVGTLDGFQNFLARQNATAHKDFLTLCAGLGDTSFPSEIAQQYELMTLLSRCQGLIGNYLEQGA